MDLVPFDEVNRLEYTLPIHFKDGKIRSKEDLDDIIEEMSELFMLSYQNGGRAVDPNFDPTLRTIYETTDDEVAGKTWRERMREHYENGGTIDDVVRIIETEAHRDANTAAYEAAKAAGRTKKTWHAMMDDKTRDTHRYLNGVTAPIDGEFYSYKGGSTKFPGQWGIAEEDVNCRCWLTYE